MGTYIVVVCKHVGTYEPTKDSGFDTFKCFGSTIFGPTVLGKQLEDLSSIVHICYVCFLFWNAKRHDVMSYYDAKI